MSDDPNDRASRLAGRWGSDADAAESAEERGDVGVDDDGADGTSEAGASEITVDESADPDDGELTTREMQSQMLYLPPEFHKELDLTFEELNLRFRRERDRKLQKNKDFYAGLLKLGLERLEDVKDDDLEAVEDLLEL